MEVPLRAALVAWLAGCATLAGMLNAVTEEAPARATMPWLAISASASIDWSCKTARGWETRIALELQCRGDDPAAAASLIAAIDAAVTSLPASQSGFVVSSVQFLRSRAEQRAANTRAILLEYRFRTQAA